jgi:hypothetical protein
MKPVGSNALLVSGGDGGEAAKQEGENAGVVAVDEGAEGIGRPLPRLTGEDGVGDVFGMVYEFNEITGGGKVPLSLFTLPLSWLFSRLSRRRIFS